jgi:uncharacterized protein YecE (DUF72 family)
MATEVKIGTSGFSFRDWKGPVYPPTIKDRDMLSYYEKELGFDTLEVNFTYYTLPTTASIEGMMNKTTQNFEFVVRSHREMTHEIWEDRERKRMKDTGEVFKKFVYGLKPMIDEGRLGCVLLQFPSFFWPNRQNHDYIISCKGQLKNIPTVVEFRNRAWVRESTWGLLRDNNLGFCVVDEPPLPRLMPFVPQATSEITYIRLHGRNKNWFKASREERYNYLYSEDELKGFLPEIEKLHQQARKGYIMFNNCHAGSAVKNALQLKKMMNMLKEEPKLFDR